MRKISTLIVVTIVFSSLVWGCKGGTMIDKLADARKTKVFVERPTKSKPEMTANEAYKLQGELVDKLVKRYDEVVIGYKLSPKTIKDPANPDRMIPVYGYLFESMKVPQGATLKKAAFIDLHLENEVAFVIGKDISPDKIKTPVDLKPYIKEVVAAIELPEIRYSGPIDDVTGIDLIVDNVVASKIILGESKSPMDIDADLIKVKMTRDGEVINEGASILVEGSPWNSLFWLVKELAKKGESLKENEIVFTGGIANFMDGNQGSYEAIYDGLGKITFKVEE